MPGARTEITEIVTGLGMVASSLDDALAQRPPELANVNDAVWDRLVASHHNGTDADYFTTAFRNGQAFLAADQALRGRPPLLVEWKGPHRSPGADPVPADLRVDHVYLVSCKYLSKVLLNAGPQRLFDRLLVGEARSTGNWFAEIAPSQFQRFYDVSVGHADLSALPAAVADMDRTQQRSLRTALADRTLPEALREPWLDLCAAVAGESARRWSTALSSPALRLRLLLRMLRVPAATYFVLGTDRRSHLRLRVDSSWDWSQHHELVDFQVGPRPSGQPEVGWRAIVRRRADQSDHQVEGHVEIRWSHGRFVGAPEAKVYLDTPYDQVPGYHLLR